jgi:hypothetical protein
VCEHAFVSIKGRSYPRFRRVLETRNLTLIRAAAAELPTVALDDALVICEVLAKQEPAKYERAALRWLARLCLERPVSLTELGGAVIALQELPREPRRAIRTLEELCRSIG